MSEEGDALNDEAASTTTVKVKKVVKPGKHTRIEEEIN
jgi:hypothetical protein